ncbi:MAG: ABC transporter permease [Puniceicoccales bacterium]|jgi:peptide/nickel transport system permease protein|nr:ABC transporter permease [Puniceicoccales bacterium]
MLKTLFRRLLATWQGKLSVLILTTLYGVTSLAPLLAPYDISQQHLQFSFHPPMTLKWFQNALYYRTYVRAKLPSVQYTPTQTYVPIQWWVPCKTYHVLGCIPCSHKLFGGDERYPFFLLGTDNLGRDFFSRLLFGGRISLSIGLVGVLITLWIGCFAGCIAGFLGGWCDFLTMRCVEFLMAIPSLYLLLALRASIGMHFSSSMAYFMIVTILACIGWTKIARVVRGMVAGLKTAAFVQAAQAMGQSTLQIFLKHFIPNLASYLLTAATLCIPSYILYEAALSFLGIGIQEPSTSWGLMLKYSQEDLKVFTLNLWWLLLPGIGISLTIIAFNLLGDALRDSMDPKLHT